MLAWLPALLWALFIFALSSRTRLPVALPGSTDKLAHLAAFLVLGAGLAWGAVSTGSAPALPVLLGLLYGAADELHQRFVPGRSPDPLDWLADAAGVLLGVAIFYPLFARRTSRRGASIP